MTHVLHVIQALTLGGAARSMIATSKYSSRGGDYLHSIVALHSTEAAAADLARAGGIVDIHTAPDDPELDALLAAADIVQLHWWNTPETERFLRRSFPPMRFVIWYHVAGDGPPHIITDGHVRMADCNIPCNPFTRYELPVFKNADERFADQRVRMVYDAADFERLSGGRLRDHDGFRVGYIGTVDFFKMHPEYVQMSAAVDVPDVRFVVCGGGKQEILRAQARALGVENKFEFRGYVNDIRSVIEELDVYGYPLCEHTYAAAELNLQEVMYLGVPPVVFPYGGVKQLVQHEKTGLVVNSPAEFTAAIEYLHAEPEMRRRLGENAERYAREVFGAENAARDLNKVYEMLMRRDKRERMHGRDPSRSLLEQPVDYYDVDINAAAPTWEVFCESLGEHAADFLASVESFDDAELFKSDAQIAASSALMFDTGIKAYRLHDGEDAVLRFWTGLVLLARGDAAAATELAAAYQQGLQHWRVLWYLARALENDGRNDQAESLDRQLRAALPDIDERIPPQTVAQFLTAAATEVSSSVEQAESTVVNQPAESSAAEQAENTALKQSAEESDSATEDILVSAIVSTYASADFLRGCLDELVGQSLFKQGRMEIIVIDAASPENEQEIVREFQQRHVNIVYERCSERESLYRSWNRACNLARGEFLANTNADDRRREDCLEQLAAALENTDAGVAYSDLAYSRQANLPYASAAQGVWEFPDFDPTLAVHYCLGCFTIMWRKTAWQALGGFNAEKYELAADFDFFTRVALQFGAAHVPVPLTMALLHDKQQSKREDRMNEESESIRAGFAELPLEMLMPGADLNSPAQRAAAYCFLGNVAMTLREPWYGPHQAAIKPQTAARWYQMSLGEDRTCLPALFNTALLTAIVGKGDVAEQLLRQCEEAAGATIADELKQARDFCSRAGKITMEMLLNIPLMDAGMESRSGSEKEFSEMTFASADTPAAQSNRRRILFTMFGWSASGGGTMFPRSVALELARRGNEVGVFYAAGRHVENPQPYLLQRNADEGVTLYGLFNRPSEFLDVAAPRREAADSQALQAFRQVLDEFKPDLVHFHNFLGLSFAIAAAARERGIPTVYTPHNYHMIDPALYLINSDLRRWKSTDFFSESELATTQPREDWEVRISAARRALRQDIDCTIAVSGRVKQLLVDFGADENKTFVVHQMPQSTNALLEQAAQKTEVHRPLRVGFIGAMIPHKGVHRLVQAMQMLDAETVECWIYGYGSPEFKQLLDQLDKKNTIRWQGEYDIADLAKIAAGLDAIVIPSVWEECAGLVLAESLAANLPVIASDIGGTSDFVHDGVNGRLYPADDAPALARILLEYIEDGEALLRLANRGVTHRFADYVDHVAGLYESMIRGERLTPERVDFVPALSVKTPQAEVKQKNQPNEESASELSPEIAGRRIAAQEQAGGFATKAAAGTLPDPLPSPLLLNVGCGRDVRDGFVNIDLFSDDPRVVAMDVRQLELADNCADAVLASDILEHFSHRETRAVLSEWARVLKPGGELVIRCPSLRLQVQAYMRGDWDADVASYMIFGGQTNPGDYHCIGFDEQSIRRHLAACGLQVESFEEEDTPQDRGFINLNMTVRARKRAITQDAPPQAELNIAWEGSQFVHHSLALINRRQCLNLIRSGLANPLIIPYEADQFEAGDDEDLRLLQRYDVRHRDVSALQTPQLWVRHQWPPNSERPQQGKWVIMQPWEFSALRRDFVDLFNRADEIWTPSTFCRRVFIDSGVDADKVQVVPNGIDPQLFAPRGPAYKLETGKRFKFLFVGGTIFRKGIDVLLAAYSKTFSASDDVCLVIKDMGGDSFYKGQTARAHIEQLSKQSAAPAIEYIDEMLSEAQMAALYRACDVFVSPYRGEGFSLPTLEAMASGLSVIVTQGGATDDFVDEHVGWLVPAAPRSIGEVIDGHAMTAETFVLEPDEQILAAHMRQVFENPGEARARAVEASLRARTHWTWQRAGVKMLSRVDALLNTDYALRSEDALRDNDDAAIVFGRAELRNKQGEVDEAISLYQQAIEMAQLPQPWLLLTLHRLASYALAADELDLAEEFLTKSVGLEEDHPDERYLRALIHMHREQWEDALDLLNPLTEQWKDNKYRSTMGLALDQLLAEIGRCLLSLDFPDDARKIFELALQMNDQNADACFGAGLAFMTIEAMEEARTMFEWALKLRPDFAAASEALESIEASGGTA